MTLLSVRVQVGRTFSKCRSAFKKSFGPPLRPGRLKISHIFRTAFIYQAFSKSSSSVKSSFLFTATLRFNLIY